MSTATIRLMQPENLAEVTRLAEKELWNYSQDVIRALFEYSPEGSFIAELQGKVIGVAMGFNLSEEEAFGGMWIVCKQHRGLGIGTRLRQKVEEYIGDRNLGIFSVAERVEPNKRSGFTVESWKVRHVSGTIATEKIKLSEDCFVSTFPSQGVQFDALIQYDTKIHTIERERFLRVWIEGESTITLVAMSKADEILGYGVIKRDSNNTILIGPLYGETPAIIKTLLVSLMGKTTFGETVDMWVPVGSEILQELLAENKSTLKVHADVTRMFYRHDVKVPQEKIFSIASGAVAHHC
ncbi:uncharacterized protein F36G3.2-like [Lingula anatina]|uniref:Uncharacterized protein F36G3.2-like n=1 Tax=Lingula anatina TaxID=7574 RepID=A0A1S3KCL6_LINAN|nr:uncharacterized protein F36G3.2-like [Lingula anatina]|eukprot:XP_013420237.1 uncharacterized protein F36G3.2-like [Lingula anatina]